jgi:pilus assembly protein CpaD
MNATFKPAGLAALLSLAATACATSPPPQKADGRPAATYADQHRIKVSQIGARLEVPIADGALTPAALKAIDDFAADYRVVGHGPLTIAAPAGLDPQLAEAVRDAVAETGILFEAVALTTYTGQAPNAPLVLSFMRYEAQAPDCPSVSEQNLALSGDNRPMRSFGCATQANLAAMVADPADLAMPRTADASDATRRSVVLDRYRQAQQTHSPRSEDERVTVSQVAK